MTQATGAIARQPTQNGDVVHETFVNCFLGAICLSRSCADGGISSFFELVTGYWTCEEGYRSFRPAVGVIAEDCCPNSCIGRTCIAWALNAPTTTNSTSPSMR